MVNVPDTKLGRMFQQHIQYILDKNIEALLDQYTDDCLLISSFMKTPKYYRGRAELREHMQGILGIQGLEDEIVFWAETENPETLMITEKITMKTAEGEAKMRFADSWVLRDGKIAIHFAGMVQHPDGTLA
jgi:ketosteroid isomerase-like protein